MNLPSAYDQLDQWKTAMFLYDSVLREINTKIEILNNEFIHVHSYNPIEHVKSRIKRPESIVKKLKKYGYEVTIDNMMDYVNDVAGIRIICSFTADIYKIAGMISRQDDVTVLTVKDYIEKPKQNGYKSYHMVVSIPIFLAEGPIDTKVEIQIRTIAMDFWASLEHKIYYKFEGNAPENISEELKECADIVDMLDRKMLQLNEAILRMKADKPETKDGREALALLAEQGLTANGAGTEAAKGAEETE